MNLNFILEIIIFFDIILKSIAQEKVYISNNTENNCEITNSCDGSLNKPYSGFLEGLIKGEIKSKANKTNSKIKFYLIDNFYIISLSQINDLKLKFPKLIDSKGLLTIFKNKGIVNNITITSALEKNFKGANKVKKVEIAIKSANFIILINKEMTIINLNFTGKDLNLINESMKCIKSYEGCCSIKEINSINNNCSLISVPFNNLYMFNFQGLFKIKAWKIRNSFNNSRNKFFSLINCDFYYLNLGPVLNKNNYIFFTNLIEIESVKENYSFLFINCIFDYFSAKNGLIYNNNNIFTNEKVIVNFNKTIIRNFNEFFNENLYFLTMKGFSLEINFIDCKIYNNRNYFIKSVENINCSFINNLIDLKTRFLYFEKLGNFKAVNCSLKLIKCSSNCFIIQSKVNQNSFSKDRFVFLNCKFSQKINTTVIDGKILKILKTNLLIENSIFQGILCRECFYCSSFIVFKNILFINLQGLSGLFKFYGNITIFLNSKFIDFKGAIDKGDISFFLKNVSFINIEIAAYYQASIGLFTSGITLINCYFYKSKTLSIFNTKYVGDYVIFFNNVTAINIAEFIKSENIVVYIVNCKFKIQGNTPAFYILKYRFLMKNTSFSLVNTSSHFSSFLYLKNVSYFFYGKSIYQ